ncbi:response regulator [Kovacikia minuta CCNUW1]|uniref:ATP-binding protein n=1 Tax=Kovacikia minuta TaxID=2931930 RepID=UPI001CC98AF6|nr:ATP-binding protein [Kovacikia minuta]UBF25243.1 response regulator [Kovacikia minuta CCNUW1]
MARVLVVEDERVIAWHLQMVLEKLGHTVVESADSGIQAIRAAETARPDLVIMDICLKGNIDGVEAAEQIYQSFNIPIIYLTAYADAATLQRAKRSSPYGYLLKPLRTQDLQSTIEITLHRHQLEQSAKNTQIQIQENLNQQLQQVSAQFSVGVICIHLLQQLFHQISIHANETDALKAVLQQLGQSLAARYCWLTRYDTEQVRSASERGKATVICEYSEDGLGDHPSLMGRVLDLQQNSEFYQHLNRRKFWLSPDNQRLPVPYQALVVPGTQLLVCSLGNEQMIIGEMGIVTTDEWRWSEQQIELISNVMGQAAIALRQLSSHLLPEESQGIGTVDRLKDEFISAVSHELRTPLTNMRMAVEMVQRVANSLKNSDANPEAQKNSQLLWQRMERYLQVLQEEWNQEFHLINDLLDFQGTGIADDPILLAPLNLQEWLPPIVNRLIPQALKQRQMLTCRVAPTLPVLTTDASSLERVMAELLNNALKYTPSGQQIRVTAEPDETWLRLSVTNTGATIPSEELDRIFQPFYRISRRDAWNFSGTGLGLALVKKLVTRLEGLVQVESDNDRTTFTVLLPL